MSEGVSICGHFSTNRKDSCGYCHTNGNSHSYGMVAYTLTVEDYQRLIDRGWRRSGTYLYKPTMEETCCPAYTIKCDIAGLKLSKSQKKILKKFNKYLCTDGSLETIDDEVDQPDTSSTNIETQLHTKNAQIPNKLLEGTSKMSCSTESIDKQTPSKGLGPDPNKIPCKKAKQIRAEKREQKLKDKGMNPVQSGVSQNQEKSIEDFLNTLPGEIKKNLELKLVKSSSISKSPSHIQKSIYELYLKYQMIIHEDPPDKCTEPQFIRFLVKSPLKSETRGSLEYGSFHQQYWLNGVLIAVGVIDILPKCVSSVYFFYDPDYNNLSIGTYGALREIAFTRELQKVYPEIKYYYMGFYIHSCVKMRYKGNFYPSFLLCPETYEWFPIKESCEKLDKEPYSRLNNDIDGLDSNAFEIKEMDNIPILVEDGENSIIVTFNEYKRNLRQTSLVQKKRLLAKYGHLVGKECAKEIVMYLY